MGGQVWISRFRLSRAWHNFAEGITIAKAQWIVFGFQSILQYISHRTVAVSYQKVYPNGDQVPFSSFMKIPLPFLESSAIDFVSCHHLAMTTPAFLIGDEWVGYYSDSSSITRLDPPMRSIIFERDHSESASIPEMLPLSTRGIDSVGAFTLVGKVDCGSGRFGFVKQYINSHSWQWSGVMTPFGMVGKWYGEGTTYGTGWFWLWKAEWTHESSWRAVQLVLKRNCLFPYLLNHVHVEMYLYQRNKLTILTINHQEKFTYLLMVRGWKRVV